MKSVVKNAWISVFLSLLTQYVCVSLAFLSPFGIDQLVFPSRDALCSVGDGTWIFIQLHSPAFIVQAVTPRTFGALQVSTKTGCMCVPFFAL